MSSRPDRTSLPRTNRRRGRAIRVSTTGARAEWTTVIGRSTIAVLATTGATALTLTVISAATTPLGWLLVGGSAVVGATPVYRHVVSSRGNMRLDTARLPRRSAALVARGAADAERLHQLAVGAPDGPVADHLGRLASTADDYVIALHGAATTATTADGRDAELHADMIAVAARLDELVESATKLRAAQRQLERSPLDRLIEETDQLRAALDSTDSDPDAGPGGSDDEAA